MLIIRDHTTYSFEIRYANSEYSNFQSIKVCIHFGSSNPISINQLDKCSVYKSKSGALY